jgi:nucleoside-diphosphate-sugar epimerase
MKQVCAMGNPRIPNYLIIGARSRVAEQFVACYGQDKFNFYGVSSKVKCRTKSKGIVLYGFENKEELKSISFERVLILSSRLPHEPINADEFLKVNDKVLSLLRSLGFAKLISAKIMFISTCSVYDPLTKSIDESSETNVSSPYVSAKLDLEKKLLSFSARERIGLLIVRVPILAYPGGSTNFMAKLIAATKDKGTFDLSNQGSCLCAIIDINSIVQIDKSSWLGHTIVNACSEGDITFAEIASLACKYGLSKVNWKKASRPSQMISVDRVREILGFTPSAKKTVYELFQKEFQNTLHEH